MAAKTLDEAVGGAQKKNLSPQAAIRQLLQKTPTSKPCIIFSVLAVTLVVLLGIMVGLIASSSEDEVEEAEPIQMVTETAPDEGGDSERSCSLSTSPEFKDAIVRAHNNYRASAYTNGSYGGNMVELTWDNGLALAATRWAYYLCLRDDLELDTPSNRRSYKFGVVGQNAFQGFTRGTDKDYANLAVLTWYNEIKHAHGKYLFPCRYQPRIAQYVQLMFAHTFRVGCALVKGSFDPVGGSKTWVICNYAPGVNCSMNVFQPSDELGSSCPPGSEIGNFGLCRVSDQQEYRKHFAF